MAYNRNISSKFTKQTFSANSPVNTKTLKEGYMLDKFGNLVSIAKKSEGSIEGDIIDLQKRHYGNATIKELLDRGFSEAAKTAKDKPTPDSFFNLYQEIFYNIPKEGKKSHTFLIEESTKYIRGYEDPKDDKINILTDKLIEIETAQITAPSEHPLFRNGLLIRHPGGAYGLMQEGHLRRIDYETSKTLRKPLGLIKEDGTALGDTEALIQVTDTTWKSLPKWPEGTGLYKDSDWGLTLNQYNINPSNITILASNIKQSELSQLEINSLIEIIQKKNPFVENTVEENTTYSTTDLLPFGTQGTYKGEGKVWYTEDPYSSREYSVEDRLREIKEETDKITIDRNRRDRIKTLTSVLQEKINNNKYTYYKWLPDPTKTTTTIIGGVKKVSEKAYWVQQYFYKNFATSLINSAKEEDWSYFE